MTRRELVPCSACARHLRSEEPACPFCGAARTPSVAFGSGAEPPARQLAVRGSSRAAAFALRAALVTATAGCAASHDPDDEPGAGPGKGAADAALTRDTGAGHDAQTGSDARVADAARDAAPDATRDAALEASVVLDAGLDANDEDAFVPIPLYGGVFPDPRTRAKV